MKKIKKNTTKEITFILLLLAETLLISCENKDISVFNSTIQMDDFLITSYSINECRSPFQIQIFDSVAIISDQDINEFIKIYNLSDFRKLSGFIKFGKGPNEFLAPGHPSVDEANKMIWLVDFPKTTIQGFAIDEVIKQSHSVQPRITIPFDQRLMPLTTLSVLPDTSILVSSTIDSSRFTLISKKGELLCSNIVNPFHNKEYSKLFQMQHLYNQFFISSCIYNHKYQKYICTYQFHEKISLIKLNISESKVLKTGNASDQKPIVIDKNIANNHINYFSITSSNSFVYSSYLGGELFDNSYNTNYPTEIHVFDWDINPIAKLSFSLEIVSFAVFNNLMYVISTDESPKVLVYKLPETLIDR